MWPVASFPQSFPKTFFGKPQSSLLTGSRSCQVSNGIKGSNATDYAGLRLDCTGGPAILFPFFAQSAEEPFFLLRVGGYEAYNGMRALYFLIFRRNIQHQHKDSAESAREVCEFYFSERVLFE